MRRITYFLKAQGGATAIEYCMIAGMISIVIVAGASLIGGNLQSLFFNKLANGLP
jgi:pilus assembly protein Flp/PilA